MSPSFGSDLTCRLGDLQEAAERLADLAAQLGSGSDFSPHRIRTVCDRYETAVEHVRGAVLDRIAADFNVDMSDPAELVGALIARANENAERLPDLISHDRETYLSQVQP